MKKLISLVILSSIVSSPISTIAMAASNPVNGRSVAEAITKTTSLSEIDWEDICPNKATLSSTGCVGNTSSESFQKVNRFTGFSTFANSPTKTGPTNNDVMILKITPASMTGVTFAPFNAIPANAQISCGVYSISGLSIRGIPPAGAFGDTEIAKSYIMNINSNVQSPTQIPLFAGGVSGALANTSYAMCAISSGSLTGATLQVY